MNISKAQKLLEVMEHEPANRAVGIQRLLAEQYELEEKFFSRKTLSTAKDVVRANFPKYLPDQYKRAGKIARTGVLGLALYGGAVGNIAGTAGNLSAMHPDERAYATHQVSRVIHEPEYRSKALKLLGDKAKDPETYKSLGRHAGMTAAKLAMPIPRLANKYLLPHKEKEVKELNPDQKQILRGAKDVYAHAEPASKPFFNRLKNDPTVGGLYSRAEKNVVKKIEATPREGLNKAKEVGNKLSSLMASYAKE